LSTTRKESRTKEEFVPQYSHVIDILPTTLELVGIRAPEQIRGIKQDAIEGTSLAYSIDDAKAPNRHTLQYYYIFGSRSIYHDGWKAELAYPSSFITGNLLRVDAKTSSQIG
jgi:arylsulfatase